MVQDLRQGLAERLIQLFVRHAALIRPLSEEGKLKLIQDLTQVTPSSCLLAPRHDNIFPTHSMRSLKLWLLICFRWSDCLPTRSSAHYGPAPTIHGPQCWSAAKVPTPLRKRVISVQPT